MDGFYVWFLNVMELQGVTREPLQPPPHQLLQTCWNPGKALVKAVAEKKLVDEDGERQLEEDPSKDHHNVNWEQLETGPFVGGHDNVAGKATQYQLTTRVWGIRLRDVLLSAKSKAEISRVLV